MRYECIREIFNLCSGNQMRDVFVSEIEIDNPDEYARQYLKGGAAQMEKSINSDGVIIYDIELDGLKQRLTLTPE